MHPALKASPTPWHKRINWTWNKVREAPPIAPGVVYNWQRRPIFGHYDNAPNVFGPYERPILDATGGGDLYARQLGPFHPNMIFNKELPNVSITGSGSELTGQFTTLPLVNTQTGNQNEVVAVSTKNGVTNISLGNQQNG